MSEENEDTMIEGIGNEVVWGLTLTFAVLVPLLYFIFKRWRCRQAQTIHPESEQVVADTREQIFRRRTVENLANEASGAMRVRSNDSEIQCPVCLGDASYAIETNCGHVFCGQCMITYWRHGTWLGAVRCPVCRQQVTILLQCFTEREQNSQEEDDIQERNTILADIHNYNRRFSGEPRPIIDYIRDLPTLLRHLWNEFFSVGGLMYMFRIRIILCFVAACMYLISPLDIIPEAIFGILGLFDDMFVFLLLAIYVSIIYRRFVTNRAHDAANT
uniref:E3 ubiquitin-protein ligase RNF170 n=1 Tax=Strigamia maritima TaxID=126957 RepID=T1JMW2_STRMM